jgi:cobalt-precorrin 5A hydrolase
MKMKILSFTEKGMEKAKIIAKLADAKAERCPKGALKEWTKEAFSQADAILFIGAVGIAVRAIAPYVKSKLTDPAVLTMDEQGRYLIPILSGHIGGANELALELAEKLQAQGFQTQAIISTATDLNGLFAVDVWAKKQNCHIYNPEKIKELSGKLLRGEEIRVYSDFEIQGEIPEGLFLLERKAENSEEKKEKENQEKEGKEKPEKKGEENQERKEGKSRAEGKCDLMLSLSLPYLWKNSSERAESPSAPQSVSPQASDRSDSPDSKEEKELPLLCIPKILVLGIGCKKGTKEEVIEALFQKVMEENHLAKEAVCKVSSIDLKKEEEGLQAFCQSHKLPFETFSAEALQEAKGQFTASDFVAKTVGVDNVCERSAVLGSRGRLLIRKRAENGVTLAIAQMEYQPSWE